MGFPTHYTAGLRQVRPGAWGGFSSPAVINKSPAVINKVNISGSFNNYGMGGGLPMGTCHYVDPGCCCDNGGSFWGGFLGGALGGLLSFFGIGGGGGGRVDGGYAGGQQPSGDEFQGLKELYGDSYNFSKIGNKYYAVSKDGKTRLEGKDLNDLMSKIPGGQSKPAETITKTEYDLSEVKEEATKFNEKFGDKASLEAIESEDPAENHRQYTLKYTDPNTNKTVTTTVRTVTEANGILEKAGVKPAGGNGDNGNNGGGDNKGGGAGDVTAKKAGFEKLFNLSSLPNGYEWDTTNGVIKGPDGKTYDTPEAAYKAMNGNSPVTVANDSELDILMSDIKSNNTLKGVYDTGNKNITDFNSATLTNYDANNNTATIGDRTYTVEIKDDYVYLLDKHSPGEKVSNGTRTNATQRYILEKSDDNKYSINQFTYTQHTEGVDKVAYTYI